MHVPLQDDDMMIRLMMFLPRKYVDNLQNLFWGLVSPTKYEQTKHDGTFGLTFFKANRASQY